MANGSERSAKTFDSFSETIQIRLRQAQNMDSQASEFSAGEVTIQLVYQKIELAT